jgi:hypothetical protein
MSLIESILGRPWPWWVSGPAIGIFIVLFAAATRRGVAVSSGFSAACARCFPSMPYFKKPSFLESWRILFMIGIPLGGLAGALLSGHFGVVTAMGCFDRAFTGRVDAKVALLLAGGLLAGFGARWAGG